MEKHYTIVSNRNRGEFFYAKFHSNYNLGDDWVPVSFSLPMTVVKRSSLPTGIVETIEQHNMIFFHDSKEIPHPCPEMDKVESHMEHYQILRKSKSTADVEATEFTKKYGRL
jgi:hypothetical protein